MRGAIESAALGLKPRHAVSNPKQKSISSNQICRSLTPLKSPPSATAHSARPPQNDRSIDFCDFHFARHWPSEMQKKYPPKTLVRICIKNVSFKMHFCLHLHCNSFFFQFFPKMCFPPSVASTFLKTDVKHFASKFSLLSPPNDPHKNIFHNFCSLLSLRCSFASLFVRSRPPSKNACGSSPVLILPPRPRLHKRLHASHLQFCKSRVLSAVFFVPAALYTHVFCYFSCFFYKFASRRRWRA